MRIAGKRIVVIGGAGLIGSHTVDALLREEPREIVVYDNLVRGRRENLADALADSRVAIHRSSGDILQRDDLDDALRGADGVFHFASLWLKRCNEHPREAFEVNVCGTFNVMEACVRHGVGRLVYASSASVYGDAVEEPMTESHPFNNTNLYGATKICGEALLRSYHHRFGLSYVGLRYMNVYGPRQDYHGAYMGLIMKMLDALDRGESPTIPGAGSDIFDLVAVEDCARANIFAMKASHEDSFYNVGTGRRTSIRQLAETMVEISGLRLPVVTTPSASPGLVRNRIGSPAKSAADLGFEAEIDVHEGLRRLMAWRSAHANEVDARRPAAR